MIAKIPNEIRLLLSMQVALLNKITSNIRGITCSCSNNKITIRCYFEGEITEENEDLMDCVEAEVIADFSEYAIDLQCITVSMPESLAQYRLSAWVYLRKE
jgi:archaellum component FlaF (FlaF/FlaG flagellin family)